jgi:hypothetical protein
MNNHPKTFFTMNHPHARTADPARGALATDEGWRELRDEKLCGTRFCPARPVAIVRPQPPRR